MGFEPMTSSLPMKCSTTELQQLAVLAKPKRACGEGARQITGTFSGGGRGALVGWTRQRGPSQGGAGRMERVEGIEPSCTAWKAVVLPLNYTRRCSARGRPMFMARIKLGPGELEPRAGLRWLPCPGQRPGSKPQGMVGRTGFEPVKAEPSDLQSDPFDRSGTSPPKFSSLLTQGPNSNPRQRARVLAAIAARICIQIGRPVLARYGPLPGACAHGSGAHGAPVSSS